MTPKVSVLIPMLNSQEFLSSCLESVLSQEVELEVILIDNGSTDNSLTIANEFAAKDSRLIIIHCKEKGVANALNAGLSACSSTFVARVDSDDCMLPGRLKNQLAIMEANPEIILLSSQVEYIDSFGQTIGISKYPTGFLDKSYHFGYMNPVAHPSTFFRTAEVNMIGGYRLQFEGAEDLDLWVRLAKIGKIFSQSEVLTQYRKHSNQVSNQSNLYRSELFFRVRNMRSLVQIRPNIFMLCLVSIQIINLATQRFWISRKFRQLLKVIVNGR